MQGHTSGLMQHCPPERVRNAPWIPETENWSVSKGGEASRVATSERQQVPSSAKSRFAARAVLVFHFILPRWLWDLLSSSATIELPQGR